MSTKLQIAITPDDEILTPEEMDRAMQRTISLLANEAGVPTRKLTLTIECKDEDADNFEDTIDAALSGRPMGVEVVLKTTKERHVARSKQLPRIPSGQWMPSRALPTGTEPRLNCDLVTARPC